jgi:phage terminase large subunit
MKSLANYNAVIIEEADEVAEDDFMQLDDSLRTLKSDIVIILLLNPPPKNHWIIKRWFNLQKSEVEGFYKPELKSTATDTQFIYTTYLDNIANLNKSTIRNFEAYRDTKPDHYYNMIRGLVSEGKRGRIFKTWKIIPDKEFEALEYAPTGALDFGFTNDPTAFYLVKEHNNKVWARELIYKTGLINDAIADEFITLGIKKSMPIYADSAEPKSIAELRLKGFNVIPATKGQDSVRAGIDLLLGKEVYYTESSINLDREVQNYCWKLDRNKEPTNDPIDDFDHGISSIRYNVFTKNRVKLSGFI